MRRLALVGTIVAAACATVTSSAMAAVGVGHSGWFWGQPQPQGETLRGLAFVGPRGYAAGDRGTVLRSDDGGITWAAAQTGITADLAKVSLISPDSAVIAGGCTARRTDNAGSTFNRLAFSNSDVGCASKLVSPAFPTPTVGYLLLDEGSLLRTADGGATFAAAQAIPGTKKAGGTAVATDIVFTSADTGVATTNAGQIFRTTNSAASWTLVATAPKALHQVVFADATTAYAVGDASTFVKSTDGGATWVTVPISAGPGPLNLVAIGCTGDSTCLISNSSGLGLLRTDNGGATFTFVTPSDQKIFVVAFVTAKRAVGLGAFGVEVISVDAGMTWSPVGARFLGEYRSIRATNRSVAYAFGKSGSLAVTLDGGQNWTPLGVPTSGDLRGVSFPTGDVGLVVDSNGVLLRTDNAGASWKNLNTGTTSKPFDVLALDPNNVLLAGPQGVRASTNGGQQFSPLGGSIASAGIEHLDRAGSGLLAWGSKKIFFSSGVKTFKPIKRPSKMEVRSVDFLSSKLGFAVTANDRVYKTTNGGRKWKELPGVGGTEPMKVSFSSATDGCAVIQRFGADDKNAYVLHTADSGASWQPELLGSGSTNDVAAPGGTDFAVTTLKNPPGAVSGLFATSTGGNQGTPTALTLATTKKKVARGTKVTVNGTLTQAKGQEQVVVSHRALNSATWTNDTVTVAANGMFTASAKINKSTVFVAQWPGDSGRSSAGSKVLTVKRR